MLLLEGMPNLFENVKIVTNTAVPLHGWQTILRTCDVV
jgi:hypothetical protein